MATGGFITHPLLAATGSVRAAACSPLGAVSVKAAHSLPCGASQPPTGRDKGFALVGSDMPVKAP